MIYSSEAFDKVLELQPSGNVLDVGCGSGQHSIAFANKGYNVTALDIQYHYIDHGAVTCAQGSYEEHEYNHDFDIVWCSHILEHQLNVNHFLSWVSQAAKEDGIIAITVPPAKAQVVSGHYTIWNAGLVLYNLVMAGIDCSNAKIKCYGYNVSVIVKNRQFKMPSLYYDYGDITLLSNYFPKGLVNGDNFLGEITELNW